LLRSAAFCTLRRVTFTESAFLKLVQARVARTPAVSGVRVGVGDDAAVLDAEGQRVVVTTDMLLDGVDVRLAECGHERAGRKALGRCLSDIAAMGVEPWCAFVSVALPGGTRPADAEALLDGLFGMARDHGCTIAGGDTKRAAAGLVIDVAMLGRADASARGPVLRSGASAGDAICVTGRLGGAAAGRHLDFVPRVSEGLRLNRRVGVSAMIDLSDGLSTDLHRLCEASGVGAAIEAARVPISEAALSLAKQDGRGALEHALDDGEDYELLFTLPAERAEGLGADPELARLVSRIGTCTPREQGVVLLAADGTARPLEARGFEHRFGARGGA
jgi:thiamine-monophosphate kinase